MRASLNNYSAGLPGSGIISDGIITAVHVGQYISADDAVCWVLAGLLVEIACSISVIHQTNRLNRRPISKNQSAVSFSERADPCSA